MNRLTKEGLITTIIGLGILIFAGSAIWFEKMTASQAAGWITTGLVFLRSKDSIIDLKKK